MPSKLAKLKVPKRWKPSHILMRNTRLALYSRCCGTSFRKRTFVHGYSYCSLKLNLPCNSCGIYNILFSEEARYVLYTLYQCKEVVSIWHIILIEF
jgi:hypothetical protein